MFSTPDVTQIPVHTGNVLTAIIDWMEGGRKETEVRLLDVGNFA